MRIIKHKTRRHARFNANGRDDGYFVVDGAHAVGTVEEAADALIECWQQKLREAPRAPTLEEAYPPRWCFGMKA